MTRPIIALLAALSIAASPAAFAQETTATEEKPAAAPETEAAAPETTAPAAESAETATTEPEEAPAAEETTEAEPAPQAPSEPQEVVKETHGDWTIVCAPNGEACVMAQKGNDANGRQVMEVRVRRLEPRTQNNVQIVAAVQIAVPIGVLLQPGVALQVDNGKKLPAAYRVCNPNACLVQEAVDEGLINAMKKGATATFTIAAPPNEQVPVEISLTGFTAAYNSLAP